MIISKFLRNCNCYFYKFTSPGCTHYEILNTCVCRITAESFQDGVVSGHMWHSHHGNLQDWLYNHSQVMGITIYLDCCRYPHPSVLPSLWKANYPALKAVMSQVRYFIVFITDVVGFLLNFSSAIIRNMLVNLNDVSL